MVGHLISKVRNDQNMTKTELSRLTGINIGHLSHIEKGDRNPSLKSLFAICCALNAPFEPFRLALGKSLNEEQELYKFIDHITYNRIPAISLNSFIPCPKDMPTSNLAIKVVGDSMSPLFNERRLCICRVKYFSDRRTMWYF